METPSRDLKYAELTDKIIGIFYDVYNELGYGFLESVTNSRSSLHWEKLV